MGRSVSHPAGATTVAYAHLTIEDEWDWEQLVDDFRATIAGMFPSAWEQDGWLGREDHVLMGNHHALFGMSEYCGLVAYWMVPRHDAGCSWTTHYHPELSTAWCKRTERRFLGAFGTLTRVGTMSNGEGVYERAARP